MTEKKERSAVSDQVHARPTPSQVLAVSLHPENDAGVATLGEYLVALLARAWRYGENFSGKRPFGYSGWHVDLYLGLARAGYVSATLSEDGYLDEISREEEERADDLIASAIQYLVTLINANGEGRKAS